MELISIQVVLETIALGVALGFIGGLFGFGGGIVAIPVLVVGFGMDQALAQGTALVMMVPNLLLGWYRYSQRHSTPLSSSVHIAFAACVTTWLMAHVAMRMNPNLICNIFSVFLLGLSIFMLMRRPDNAANANQPSRSTALLPLVGILGGSSMGLLGIGGWFVGYARFYGMVQAASDCCPKLLFGLGCSQFHCCPADL